MDGCVCTQQVNTAGESVALKGRQCGVRTRFRFQGYSCCLFKLGSGSSLFGTAATPGGQGWCQLSTATRLRVQHVCNIENEQEQLLEGVSEKPPNHSPRASLSPSLK